MASVADVGERPRGSDRNRFSSVEAIMEKQAASRRRKNHRFTLTGLEIINKENFDHGGTSWWNRVFEKCIHKIGGRTTPQERGWIMYDVADSPISLAHNLVFQMMLGDFAARTLWLPVSAITLNNAKSVVITFFTFFLYLTMSSSAEYGRLKTKFLYTSAHVGAFCLCMSLLVVDASSWGIVVVLILDILSKIFYRICSVAYDALLFPVTNGSPARQHMVNSLAVLIGYVSMGVFGIIVGGLTFGISLLYWDFADNPETVSNDSFLTMSLVRYRMFLFLLGVWWIVFTREAFLLFGDLPYGIPYPNGLKIDYSCVDESLKDDETFEQQFADIDEADIQEKFRRLSDFRRKSKKSDDGNPVNLYNDEKEGEDQMQGEGMNKEGEGLEEDGVVCDDNASTVDMTSVHVAPKEELVPESTDVHKGGDVETAASRTLKPSLSMKAIQKVESIVSLGGPEDDQLGHYSCCQIARFAFIQGFIEIARTLMTMKRKKMWDLFAFMIALMLITDGMSSVTTNMVLVATTQWKLQTVWIAISMLCLLIMTVTGVFFFRSIIKKKLLGTFTVLKINAIFMIVAVVGLALMEFPPAQDDYLKNITNGNVTKSVLIEVEKMPWWEDRVGHHILLIALGCLFIMNYVSFNAFMKSSICALTPEHFQSSVFAMCELTQKGAAIVGPLVIIALSKNVNESDEWKVVLGVSGALLLVGFPFLFLVDENRGHALAEVIDRMRVKKIKEDAVRDLASETGGMDDNVGVELTQSEVGVKLTESEDEGDEEALPVEGSTPDNVNLSPALPGAVQSEEELSNVPVVTI